MFFVSFRNFFFGEFNIRLYDKNSESDYFFPLHQNQNIFSSNIGNQNIFLESPLLLKFNVMIIKTKDLLPHKTYVILAILFKSFGLSAPKMV